MATYARSILSEFAYARFYADGFGKSFNAINLREEGGYGDELLLAGLLTFYEQTRLFDEQAEDFAPYHVARPLHVFVGAQVNAGPEVLQIVDFLNRVLTEQTWAERQIGLLLRGRSGLLNNGVDVFADAFPYLRHIGASPRTAYRDLLDRLFGGRGRLTLHYLARAEGEIAIRTSDAARDAYSGVINVGDPEAFLDRVVAESTTGVAVGSPDVFTESLFSRIEQADSQVNFLIGSKKFIEGWSSWRVSVMALLKVGSRAGAQVLQLFGRGVRLRGRDNQLKRSTALPGEHPMFLPLLEQLSVFGLKANYLKTFLDTLLAEGLEPTETRLLPVTLRKGFVPLRLPALEVDPAFSFADEVLTFSAAETEAVVDLSLRAQAGGAEGLAAARMTFTEQALPDETVALLDIGALARHARNHKTRRGWFGLFISDEEVETFVRSRTRVAVPDRLLRPQTRRDLAELERVAELLVENGVDRFFLPQQRRAESARLRPTSVDAKHPNFPQVTGRNAYQLEVPTSRIGDVDRLLSNRRELAKESASEPIPRLHWDRHLYNPITVRGGIATRPSGLVSSESRFLVDLRNFWRANRESAPWSAYDLYVLRNLPKKGIGFFQSAGFYPDFLVWLHSGDHQGLTFVDPKGLMLVGEFNEKLRLAETLEKTPFGFPVTAFIVTPTPLATWPPHQGLSEKEIEERRSELADRHILEQTGSYVDELMRRFEAVVSQ